MPKDDNIPEKLRPYLSHGVDLDYSAAASNAVGDCPVCGREDKFSVKLETGEYQCFKCGARGNARVFLRWLHSASDEATTDYLAFQADRGLLYEETLMQWGVCRSVLTGGWLVPGYGADGKLNQLYQYASDGNGKRRLIPTPTMGHQLHGVNLYDKRKQTLYLCEGPWDAMALWETLQRTKATDDGVSATSSQDRNLLTDANVLAVPGCTTFDEKWLPLFADKDVCLMYDSDHPRKHPKTGNMVAPAGFSGMRRAMRIMSAAKNAPRSLCYLHWGKDGYDPERPSGYDLRDHLSKD